MIPWAAPWRNSLAGLVLLLGEVAAWSHRVRTPLLLLLIGLAGGFLYFIDRFHDVRWTGAPARASAAMGEQQHVPLAEAVRRWKLANECLPEHRRPCPRPIVIAEAGGATRAAFLTATVVGALIDLGQDPAKAAVYGEVHKRIFAMSTVSGSSVGALVVPAALADTAEIGAPAPPPCTTEGAGSWFGKFAKAVAEPGVRFDPTRSWRDCFQLILAGDFLSPVMVGLAYRDTFPLGNPFSGTPLPTPAPGCRCFSSTERLYAIGVYELKPPQSAVSDQRKTMPLRENPLCRQVVRKRAAMGHVSMSWWMSQSVQAYLDAQLCVKAIGSGWNASCGKAARQQAETASPSRRCWKRKRADDAARKCLTCRARAWAGAAGSIALIAHTRSTPVNNSHSVSADSDAARGPFPIVVCYGSLIVSCIAAASRLTSQWNVGRLAMQGTGAIEMAAVRVLVRTLLGTRA
jgi:hypothetical protein